MPGEGLVPQLALSWEMYSVAPAPLGEMVAGVACETVADNLVVEAECKHLLQNLRHEARVQVVRDYYASTNIRRQKKKCCGNYLSKDKYMKVITYS